MLSVEVLFKMGVGLGGYYISVTMKVCVKLKLLMSWLNINLATSNMAGNKLIVNHELAVNAMTYKVYFVNAAKFNTLILLHVVVTGFVFKFRSSLIFAGVKF